MKRSTLLSKLATKIVEIDKPHPIRIAIDGVDGIGKTTLADELVEPVQTLGREVVRASVDGFHNPRQTRYRTGKESPEGFFRDSYNYPLLQSLLLDPLGSTGNRKIKRAAFDYRTDSPIEMEWEDVGNDAILLFDGIFLHRPELVRYWALSIFLQADFSVTVARGAERDNGDPNVEAASNRRYVEGQKLYLRECHPEQKADIVIDMTSLEDPEWKT